MGALLHSAQVKWSLSSAGLLRPYLCQSERLRVSAGRSHSGWRILEMKFVEQSCCWPFSTSCCWTRPASLSCSDSHCFNARAEHPWQSGTSGHDGRDQDDATTGISSLALRPTWLSKGWALSPTAHPLCCVGSPKRNSYQHSKPRCNNPRYLAVLILLPQRAQLPVVVLSQLLLLCGQVSAHLLLPLILPLQTH